MTTAFFSSKEDLTVQASPEADAKVEFDAVGGRVIGVILSLYGLAVLFEVVNSYILAS